MAVIRRRLLFWLIKAYLKKWGKFIVLSFVAGLVIFFSFIFFSQHVARLFPQRERIGLVGAYTIDNLPPLITQRLSRGLTKVTQTGEVLPDLAESWEIKENGRVYVFHLKKNQRFSNNREVTSATIPYSFADVAVDRPDKYTLIYHLKVSEGYAPFLVTVSRPIFPKGLQGLGDATINDAKFNGNFLSSLTLTSRQNKQKMSTYVFYPNQETLKTAFLLGETTTITGINDPLFKTMDLTKQSNTVSNVETNYNQLVTVFYNLKDPVVSDNKLRKGLAYAIPDQFKEGERAYVPYSSQSIYFSKEAAERTQDLAHAQLLLDASYASASVGARPVITIKTLAKYKKVTDNLVAIWTKLGLRTKVEEVDSVPDRFQIYIGDFSVPKDPDQYTLWHSDQPNNITKFRSLRIDKLLEDGRKTLDLTKRKQIYAEFQRYLLEDAVVDTPASFLYFPYSYTIKRR